MSSRAGSASLVAHAILGPHQLQDLDGLVQPGAALAERHAEHLVLGGDVAKSEADGEAAVGDDVQGGQFLGQHDRVVERCDHDLRHEPDVRVELACQPGQHRHRLQPA